MTSIRKRLIRRPVLLDPLQSKLHTEASEVVNAILDGKNDTVIAYGAGLVLQDSAGHWWRVEVSTLGALTTTDLGTDRP